MNLHKFSEHNLFLMLKRRCLDALVWLFHLNHHDSSRQQAESWVESLKHCDVNDALVALNLWHSAGGEPGLAWIADVGGCDLWLGQSKMSATTRLSVSLPERLFVCDCMCVCVCVSETEETETHSSACFNVSKNVCVCEQACLLARQYVCFLHHKAPVL